MFPKFLGIGAQKAGTTWLHKMLSQHPEIWLPHLKELHYFDRRFPIRDEQSAPARTPAHGGVWRRLSTRLRHAGLRSTTDRLRLMTWPELRWEIRYQFSDLSDRWYESLFQYAGNRLPGEITPAYSCLDQDAIGHVHALMPDAKIILLLRDPVERAWSHALMDLVQVPGKRGATVDDAQFVRHFTSFASRRRGDYPGMIRRWMTRYSGDQLFIGFYDEIESTPEALLGRIFRFLDVNDSAEHMPPGVRMRFNAGAGQVMPARLRAFLSRLYEDDLRELAARYGTFPQKWLDQCQRTLEPALAAGEDRP